MHPRKKGLAKRRWAKAIRSTWSEARELRKAEKDETPFFSRLVSSNTPLSLSLSLSPFLVETKNLVAAALNPTYTYGKRADSGGNAATSSGSGWMRTDASSGSFPSRTSSPVEIAAAAKASSSSAAGGASTPLSLGTPPLGATPPKKVYDHHGHKGNLLMNPLPDIVVVPAAEKA